MTTQEKLKTIKKVLGETQTRLAERFGVSFAAFNAWWNGRSVPRKKALVAIDELFLEVTGQKVIPKERLDAKKRALRAKASEHTNVVAEILNHPDIRDRFVLKLTYHSNRIEGSTLSEPDTRAVLFDNSALPDKSMSEQLEAKNHQAALEYLFGHAMKKGRLDEPFILKLHGMLLNGIRPDAGAYRRHAVRIVGANVPTANHLRVTERMAKVMAKAAKARSTGDILALSAEVHAEFEKIHPFSDGNGRTGRLLMTAMLLVAGYAPAVIRQSRKRLYYAYLNKAQTRGDHSQLEDFLCDAVEDGFAILERHEI